MATGNRNRPALADYADKDITPRFQAYADWVTEQTGYAADALSIQLAIGLDKEWRTSDAYRGLRESVAAAKQAEIDARAARKAEQLAARAAKLREQLAKLEGTTAATTETDEVTAKRLARAQVEDKPAPVASPKAKAAAKAAPAKATKAAPAKAASKPAPKSRSTAPKAPAKAAPAKAAAAALDEDF